MQATSSPLRMKKWCFFWQKTLGYQPLPKKICDPKKKRVNKRPLKKKTNMVLWVETFPFSKGVFLGSMFFRGCTFRWCALVSPPVGFNFSSEEKSFCGGNQVQFFLRGGRPSNVFCGVFAYVTFHGGLLYSFSRNHGSVESGWLYLKGNYCWRDPFFLFHDYGRKDWLLEIFP